MIDRVQWSTGATTGDAGASTATGYSVPGQGEVLAVHVAYVGSPPNTTDVTLSDEDDPASEAIVTDAMGSDVSPVGAKTLTKAVPVNGSTTTLRNPVSTGGPAANPSSTS